MPYGGPEEIEKAVKKELEEGGDGSELYHLLDSYSYDDGQLESMKGTIKNLQRVQCKLVFLLIAKKVITEEEAIHLLYT